MKAPRCFVAAAGLALAALLAVPAAGQGRPPGGRQGDRPAGRGEQGQGAALGGQQRHQAGELDRNRLRAADRERQLQQRRDCTAAARQVRTLAGELEVRGRQGLAPEQAVRQRALLREKTQEMLGLHEQVVGALAPGDRERHQRRLTRLEQTRQRLGECLQGCEAALGEAPCDGRSLQAWTSDLARQSRRWNRQIQGLIDATTR